MEFCAATWHPGSRGSWPLVPRDLRGNPKRIGCKEKDKQGEVAKDHAIPVTDVSQIADYRHRSYIVMTRVDSAKPWHPLLVPVVPATPSGVSAREWRSGPHLDASGSVLCRTAGRRATRRDPFHGQAEPVGDALENGPDHDPGENYEDALSGPTEADSATSACGRPCGTLASTALRQRMNS
jgi:hypothetical protein